MTGQEVRMTGAGGQNDRGGADRRGDCYGNNEIICIFGK